MREVGGEGSLGHRVSTVGVRIPCGRAVSCGAAPPPARVTRARRAAARRRACRDGMSSRGAASRRSRSTSSDASRTGSGGPLAVICASWLSSSACDGCSMNRATSWSWCWAATLAVLVAHAQERRGVRRNHSVSPLDAERVEELVEEAPAAQAVPQALLVLRGHEEHLLHEELRVVRVVPATQPEQQVDLVDAGEVAGVCAAVLLPPYAVRLVVRAHAVEEARRRARAKSTSLKRPTSSSAARASSKSVSETAVRCRAAGCASARPRRACTRGSRACCSRGRGSRREAT